MNNFLDFINEDIEAKKLLLSSMPLNGKANQKKYNKKIDSMIESYEEYKENIKKYLVAKSNSFEYEKDNKDIQKLKEKYETLNHIREILNPNNTYFEKMGFDDLLFDMLNFSNFDFVQVNEIIGKFIDKFESVGIKLTEENFEYTYYVHEYMTSFLNARKNGKYEILSTTFERIYWLNPDLINDIVLCFRRLIRKNERIFEDYISSESKRLLMLNKIRDYNDCKEQYKVAYDELMETKKESISQIVELFKEGTTKITNYFEDSKFVKNAFSSMTLKDFDMSDKTSLDKFYESLKKLDENVDEYENYLRFKPLFDNFKKKYGKPETSETIVQNIKKIESQIAEKENRLENINRIIFNKAPIGFSFLRKNSPEAEIKKLKIESLKITKDIYELYKKLDDETFKKDVSNIFSDSMLISEVVRLYESFSYHRKLALKETLNLEEYKTVMEYSDDFEKFANNPDNVIINGIYAMEENNVAKNIMNKYRFENINITENDLEETNLSNLKNKIEFLLRIKSINESSLSVEKIWFIVSVDQITNEKKAK